MMEMLGGPALPNSLVRRRIFGVDFSGARDAGKKVWIAAGAVVNDVLHIQECYRAEALPNSGRERDRCLASLRELVTREKTAVFGFDFPFGLPQELVPETNDWEAFALAFPERYPDAETSLAVHEGKVYAGLGNGGRALCVIDAAEIGRASCRERV